MDASSRRAIGSTGRVANLLAVILLVGEFTGQALAVDIRPDPQSTEGSVRIDGHSRELVCDPFQKPSWPDDSGTP
jgi:hypothetical protein